MMEMTEQVAGLKDEEVVEQAAEVVQMAGVAVEVVKMVKVVVAAEVV